MCVLCTAIALCSYCMVTTVLSLFCWSWLYRDLLLLGFLVLAPCVHTICHGELAHSHVQHFDSVWFRKLTIL